MKNSKTLIYCLIILNIFDILLHIAIKQPEALRISGNVIIILASIVILSGILSRKTAMILSLALYLVLNGIFILGNGIGGMGIALILLTSILSILLIKLPPDPFRQGNK